MADLRADKYEDMSLDELERLLTRKERRFVEEYDLDGNGTQAAIRAGYTPGKKNASAAVQASKLLRSAKVSAYRRARANELCRQLGISSETIRLNVMDIYRRCMVAKPVLKYDPDLRDWVETGEYVFDSKGALKAMELLGKPLGVFDPAPPGGGRDQPEDDPITRALKEDGYGPVR